MKKILFVVSNMRVGGGAERSTSYLCKGLSKHYDVELLTFYDSSNEYDYNVKRHSFNYPFPKSNLIKPYLFFVKYPFKLKRFLKRNKYDLVISGGGDSNLVTSLTKRFYRKFEHWIIIRSDIKGRFYNSTKFLYKSADKIITVCKSLENKFSKVFPQNKFKTLHNAIDFEEIQEKSKEKIAKTEEKLYSGKTITAVGRLAPQKNYFFLIDVFKEVLKQKNDVKLLIFGAGPQEEKIKRKIKEEGLQDKVKMMGIRRNIFPYLKKTDIFVLASNFEGMPRALMESLAVGCVSVANDCMTGPRELMEVPLDKKLKNYEKTKYGYLVPFNNKKEFIKALNDALENGKKIKPDKRFALDNIVEKWVEEIEKIR